MLRLSNTNLTSFFGEQLPKKFFGSLTDFQEADLLIVMGTSLQVQPFASLISTVPIDCPRLLINLEAVGEIGRRGGRADPGGFDFEGIHRGGKEFIRDVLMLGTTDDGVDELCDLLGWKDELLDLYESPSKFPTHGGGLSSTSHEDAPEVEGIGGGSEKKEKVLDSKDDESQLPREAGCPDPDSALSSSFSTNPTSAKGSGKLPGQLVSPVGPSQPPADHKGCRKLEEHVDQLTTTINHLSLSENLQEEGLDTRFSCGPSLSDKKQT